MNPGATAHTKRGLLSLASTSGIPNIIGNYTGTSAIYVDGVRETDLVEAVIYGSTDVTGLATFQATDSTTGDPIFDDIILGSASINLFVRTDVFNYDSIQLSPDKTTITAMIYMFTALSTIDVTLRILGTKYTGP